MTVVGPSLPPHMLWDKLFRSMMPDLYAKYISLSLQISPFASVKWNMEADANTVCQGNSVSLLQRTDSMADSGV
jgi:hypothetical protein